MKTWLSDLCNTRPAFSASQDETLAWLNEAHAESERTTSNLAQPERDAFHERIQRWSGRSACRSPAIERRGFALADVGSLDWQEMQIYNLSQMPRGEGMGARTKFFSKVAGEYLEKTFQDVSAAPGDLLHVTCTGFVSPSPAQRMVSGRGWATRVTHAYQMGCYAALPALRIARGFAAVADWPRGTAPRVDVIHTEICSLHLDPSLHTVEQMVVQSLFADGFIRYSVAAEQPARGYEILALNESLVPGTEDAMCWTASEYGMRMTLSRDVPQLLGGGLRQAVTDLYRIAGLSMQHEHGKSLVAVHPGGPKVIDQVRDLLELREPQVAHSRGILRDYGNMSSATLPHVWQRMGDDDQVAAGTIVLNLAFGPGLTIAGGLFRKL